ncbi:MAG: hypothetical protein ACHQ1D_04385 [Nitrososphaerales archaeon]
MIIPDEFRGRVVKTRLNGLTTSFKRYDEIQKLWPESEIDVVYEDGKAFVVVVFESTEDCLAFKLKYGDKYA